jgi:hypothetical protein
MSTETELTAHPPAENDHVDSRAVVLVGVGALVVFALAGLSAIGYLRHRVGEAPALPIPSEIGDTKIGLVEQQLFESGPLRSDRARAAQLARLHGAGWVDRTAGLVHIPIELAMALVAQGVRAGPAAPGTTPALGAANGGVDAPSVPIAAPAAPPPAGRGPSAGKGTTR